VSNMITFYGNARGRLSPKCPDCSIYVKYLCSISYAISQLVAAQPSVLFFASKRRIQCKEKK